MQRQKQKRDLNPPRQRSADQQPGSPEGADATGEELNGWFATADSSFDQIHSSDSEEFLRQSKQTGGQ